MLRDVTIGYFEGYRTAFINTTHSVSDVGNALLQRFPQVEVAFCWRHSLRRNLHRISLRSRVGGVDVAALATRYGGGGHAAAAAMQYCGAITDLYRAQLADLDIVA